MRLRVDEKNDALYFGLDEAKIVESEEVRPGVILDYDGDNNVIGIEILGLRKRVPAEAPKTLQFETAQDYPKDLSAGRPGNRRARIRSCARVLVQ